MINIVEKLTIPPSNLAVLGLYILDETAPQKAKKEVPSGRGELAITDLLNVYRAAKQLKYCILDRGTAWPDTGRTESLLEASMFVQTIEKRQGQKTTCLEEIGFLNSWVSRDHLLALAEKSKNSDWGDYLIEVVSA